MVDKVCLDSPKVRCDVFDKTVRREKKFPLLFVLNMLIIYFENTLKPPINLVQFWEMTSIDLVPSHVMVLLNSNQG